VRIVVLGDRDPKYLTHRELDAALSLFPDSARRLDRDGRSVGTPSRGRMWRVARARRPLSRRCGGLCGDSAQPGHGHTIPGDLRGLSVCVCQTGPLPSWSAVRQPRGERRLVAPVPGTRLARICGDEPFEGFHWCGYGLADEYVPLLTRHGVTVGARAADAGVEAIELGDHPFFMATAFQPQVGASETGSLHPLILAFLQVALAAALEAAQLRHEAERPHYD
jgi:hypothetical protein